MWSFGEIIRIFTGMFWVGSLICGLGRWSQRDFFGPLRKHTQNPRTEMIIVFYLFIYFLYKGINCGYLKKVKNL